jgi:hypothetical protein
MPDNTVKSYEEFFISTNTTYRKEEYTYDNTNNLIAMTAKDTLGNILQTITYIRDAVKRTSITSFMNRLGGDLFWFNQTKWFNMYPFFNEFDYSFAASAPLKITFPFRFNGSSFSTFTNSYDSKGNLITAVEKNDSGQVISKTEITYN